MTGPLHAPGSLPLYARHGMPSFWLVDLAAGVLLRCRRLHGEAHAEAETLRAPAWAAVQALPGVAIENADVLAG